MQRLEFKDAQTVAYFLLNEVLQHKAKGQVVWIAQAMANVFDLGEKLDARVLLKVIAASIVQVERGTILAPDEAGIWPTEVKE
jgi:hypothetical protein